jgi:hypothetical protein
VGELSSSAYAIHPGERERRNGSAAELLDDGMVELMAAPPGESDDLLGRPSSPDNVCPLR